MPIILSLPIPWLLLCYLLLALYIYMFLKRITGCYFWETRGMPLLDPIPFFGEKEFMQIFTTSYVEIIDRLYQKARRLQYKYCWIFQFSTPTLMFLDPRLIGNILTKDFEYFSDRFDLPYDETHAISQQLFSVPSSKWKDLSKQISPVASPGRIDFMIQEMDFFFDHISPPSTVNVEKFAFDFNKKIVGESSLSTNFLTGYQALNQVKKLIDPSAFNFIRFYLPLLFPCFEFLTIPQINNADLCASAQDLFSSRQFKKILRFGSRRNDVFTFFVELQAKLSNRDIINNKNFGAGGSGDLKDVDADFLNISRRLFWFMVDSQGTSSLGLSFVLHLISLHPECQEKIKLELERTLKERDESQVTYQVVRDLKYTHNVIKECLRLYTPMSLLQRVCTKDYQIPGSTITIPRGTKVIIPIYSIQRDAEYFPDPLVFKPSRFNDLTQIAPYTFMPFGEGPRFCIGYRFAMAHLKFAVAKLVSKFHIESVSSDQNVLSLHPFSPSLLRTGKDILVRFKNRDKERKKS